jgi:hypothetical protein
MNFQKILFLCFLCGFKNIKAQCPPVNPSIVISGLHTSNINATNGSIVYVASSATVTGDISLNNASLYNCGSVLSQKISMKQSTSNNQYVLENNNMMICDTIFLDSLGHIHNNDTLICKEISLRDNSVVDNHYLMDVNNLIIAQGSLLNSEGLIKTDYFQLKDTNSQYYSFYGSISARKLFRVGNGSIVSGIIFICADSSFINNGLINNSSALTWTPSIRTAGLSQNTGTIANIDFCDLSSTNGGLPDVNTGLLFNLTFCSSPQYFCDFTYTSVRKNSKTEEKIFIYPNPAIEKVNLFIELQAKEIENMTLSIINTFGQVVYSKENLQEEQEIDLSFLSDGIYYMFVQNDLGKKAFKIIKNK